MEQSTCTWRFFDRRWSLNWLKMQIKKIRSFFLFSCIAAVHTVCGQPLPQCCTA